MPHSPQENLPYTPHQEVAVFTYLLSIWAAEPALVTSKTECEYQEQDCFTPEELFGKLYETDRESCERILARADWAAEQLTELVAGSALVDAEKELSFEEAHLGLQWIMNCIPQVIDGQGSQWHYETFDTKRYSDTQQFANIFSRFLPHSWLAGVVGWSLAKKLNETQAEPILNENKVLWDLYIHEVGRAITHNRAAHDKLLPYMLHKAGVLKKYWPVEGAIHPRVLAVESSEELGISERQLEQIVEWVADIFSKASDENAPYDTSSGQPELRKVECGLQYMLYSMLGYDAVPEEKNKQRQLWVSILRSNGAAFYYLLEHELINEVPHWFEKMGISIQEILDEWQPHWRSLLTSLVEQQQLPDWFIQMGMTLPAEISLHPDQPWIVELRQLPQEKKVSA